MTTLCSANYSLFVIHYSLPLGMVLMEDVAIVIPVYKSTLSDNERLALKQCLKVFADYRICLVMPRGLDVNQYRVHHDALEFVEFEPYFFENVAGYSKLMMSSRFYRRFLAYQYILIYQLDAYAFRDELLMWCNKGYDYIGAPWIEKPPQTKEKVWVDFSKRLVNQVGNGGFSLRKVQSHWRITRWLAPLIYWFPKHEDLFWCYFVPKLIPSYKRPPVKVALAFAFELAPRKAYAMNDNRLPFGCHAWEKYDYAFWEEFIKAAS